MDQSKKARASDAGESPAVHCVAEASRIRSIAGNVSLPTLSSISGNGTGQARFVAGTRALFILVTFLRRRNYFCCDRAPPG
jgi:hypothetical protein